MIGTGHEALHLAQMLLPNGPIRHVSIIIVPYQLQLNASPQGLAHATLWLARLTAQFVTAVQKDVPMSVLFVLNVLQIFWHDGTKSHRVNKYILAPLSIYNLLAKSLSSTHRWDANGNTIVGCGHLSRTL